MIVVMMTVSMVTFTMVTSILVSVMVRIEKLVIVVQGMEFIFGHVMDVAGWIHSNLFNFLRNG